MALLHEAVEEKKLDVRLIERNVARGYVSQEDVEKAAKKLSDDSDNAEWVNVETLAADDSEASTSH
jgi:hypothetical protein